MTLLCLLFSFSLADETWQLKDLDIFHKLKANAVTINKHGIYINDLATSKILRFSLEGQRLSAFGGRGEGPGEFQFVSKVDFYEGEILVTDRGSVHRFEPDGTLIKTQRFPGFARATRCANGWLYVDPKYREDHTTITLFWSNETFSEKRPLFERSMKTPKRNEVGEKDLISFNPVHYHLLWRMDKNRKRIYLWEGKGFHVRIIDLITGEDIGSIKKSVKPVPFDETWGQEALQAHQAQNPDLIFKADFPDSFPVIRDIALGADGRLWIWGGHPDREQSWCFDRDGKEIANAKLEDRNYLGQVGNYRYFSTFDEEEEIANIRREAR